MANKSAKPHVEGHTQYFSPSDMKKMLQENGFEVLKIKNIGNWFFASLGQVYLAIARK